MPNYTAELTRRKLKRYLDRCGVKWQHELTEVRWSQFLEWSRLDPEKHNSLTTLADWKDEWAEFDCAYEDWMYDNSIKQPDVVRVELAFEFYPNFDGELANKPIKELIQYCKETAYEDTRNLLNTGELFEQLSVRLEWD
jgi:hypothetical protein